MATFVDYNSADPITNNDCNVDTSLHRNDAISVDGEGGLVSSSVLRAGLGTGEDYCWKGMTREVCSLGFNPSRCSDCADIAMCPHLCTDFIAVL